MVRTSPRPEGRVGSDRRRSHSYAKIKGVILPYWSPPRQGGVAIVTQPNPGVLVAPGPGLQYSTPAKEGEKGVIRSAPRPTLAWQSGTRPRCEDTCTREQLWRGSDAKDFARTRRRTTHARTARAPGHTRVHTRRIVAGITAHPMRRDGTTMKVGGTCSLAHPRHASYLPKP